MSTSISDAQIAIRNQRSFTVTTGQLTTGADSTVGFAVFNPATSGKNLYIYSLRSTNSGATSIFVINALTTDPNYATKLTPQNLWLAATPTSVVNATARNSTGTSPGTSLDVGELPQAQHFEQLTNGTEIIIPPGNGLGYYDFVANTLSWSVTLKWYEQ